MSLEFWQSTTGKQFFQKDFPALTEGIIRLCGILENDLKVRELQEQLDYTKDQLDESEQSRHAVQRDKDTLETRVLDLEARLQTETKRIETERWGAKS
jgi:hypothetical protein